MEPKDHKDNPFSGQAIQVYLVTILFFSVTYMLVMILPFYALTFGANNTEIGWILGITMFVSMFFRPVAGTMIDRYGAGRVFTAALFVYALSLFGYFVPHLWMFGLIRTFQGVFAAFFSTAMSILTIELLSPKARGQGLSLFSLASMIPSTFGPALALYLKDHISFQTFFILFSVMGIFNFLIGVLVARKLPKKAPTAKQASSPRRPGLWKNRVLLFSSSTMLLISVTNGAIFSFLPLSLESQHSNYAIVYFLTQTVTLVITRFAGRKFIPTNGDSPKSLIAVMGIFVTAGTLMIGLTTSLPVLLLAAVLNGIALALMYPTLVTFVSFSVPEHAKGFLLGLFIGAADLGFSLGSLAMGPIIDTFSYRAMYLTCSALCALGCFLFLFYKHRSASLAQNLNETSL